MIHRKEIERLYSVVKETRGDLLKELSSLPQGDIYVRRDGDNKYYYQRFPKTGNRKKVRRKGITGDRQMVNALVRKRYINKAIAIIDEDISLLESMLKKYVPFDEESVMSNFIAAHPELSGGIYHGKQSDAEWADDYIRQKDFYEEDLTQVSADGIKMRSKSEMYIASRLDHYGIPYRYEASVPHPDTEKVPDFTIRRPRDGKIIYWEHLGLIGDSGYMESNGIKFMEYENADIVPWDNLIITYDMKDGGIDGRIVDAMIQAWLL